jgi:hypothetical protein
MAKKIHGLMIPCLPCTFPFITALIEQRLLLRKKGKGKSGKKIMLVLEPVQTSQGQRLRFRVVFELPGTNEALGLVTRRCEYPTQFFQDQIPSRVITKRALCIRMRTRRALGTRGRKRLMMMRGLGPSWSLLGPLGSSWSS